MSEQSKTENNAFYSFTVSIFFTSIVFLIGSAILMYVWNGFAPQIFNLPELTFGQSCCMLVFRNIMIAFNEKSFQLSSTEKKEEEE